MTIGFYLFVLINWMEKSEEKKKNLDYFALTNTFSGCLFTSFMPFAFRWIAFNNVTTFRLFGIFSDVFYSVWTSHQLKNVCFLFFFIGKQIEQATIYQSQVKDTYISAPMIHRTLNIWMQLQVPCHAMPCVAWFKPSSIHIECYMYCIHHIPHILNFEWMALFFVVVDFLHFSHGKLFNPFRTYNAFPLVSLCWNVDGTCIFQLFFFSTVVVVVRRSSFPTKQITEWRRHCSFFRACFCVLRRISSYYRNACIALNIV